MVENDGIFGVDSAENTIRKVKWVNGAERLIYRFIVIVFIEICSWSYLVSVGWKLLIASKCQEGYHPSDAKLSCFAGSLTPPTWSCLEDILSGVGGPMSVHADIHKAMTTLKVQACSIPS